jgi:hypothetical protein
MAPIGNRSSSNARPGDTVHLVDRVEVRKAERKLLLLHGSDIVRPWPSCHAKKNASGCASDASLTSVIY